jgi:molybdate transport repressor ModE-like protein
MLDLRRLRVLRAIAREGSMAGAARALDYTQPAIGHHVRRLEAEVGTPLVVRDGRGVRLTPAGAALAARADAILAGVEAAHEEVAAIAGLREGRVRLVAFPSGSATIVPAALAALTKRHPGLEVTLAEAEPPESLELLRGGECDVALAFEYPGVEVDEGSGLVKRPLAVDPLHAVLPADHPLAAPRRVDLRRLRDATWIAGCPRCRGHLVHLCAEAGFAPRIAYATDDHVAVQAMVGAGLGVALLPGLVLDVVHRDDVVVRPVTRSPTRTVTAVTTEGAAAIPAVAALLTALAEVAATRAPARAAA